MPEAAEAVTAASPKKVVATIANGASLSAGVLVDGRLTAILTPAAWTAAAMTFQGSADGETYADLYTGGDGTAAELTVASASIPTAAQRLLTLTFANLVGIKFIKVRSGTTAAAVAQGAARDVTLLLAG